MHADDFARAAQEPAYRASDQRFVVHDQDAHVGDHCRWNWRRLAAARRGLTARGLQMHDEARPGTYARVDVDPAVHLLYHVAADGEAEPRPRSLTAREEWLENAGQILGRNTAAVVGHLDTDVVTAAAGRDAHHVVSGFAIRHGVDGIDDQIDQHLHQAGLHA